MSMANPDTESKKFRKKSDVYKFKNNKIIEKKEPNKVRMGDWEICGVLSEINYQGRCKKCRYLLWKFSQNKGVLVRGLKRLDIPYDKIKYVLKEEWNMILTITKAKKIYHHQIKICFFRHILKLTHCLKLKTILKNIVTIKNI